MIIPIGISDDEWEVDWANSLLIDFPNDNIPILTSPRNWRNWGSQLVQSTSFSENNAPGPAFEKDFKTYAERLFYVMSNNA
jgi:hypothetical protein